MAQLRSMTGHGEARGQQDQTLVSVDVRAVNHRFLKVVTRTTEGYAALEPLVEGAIRRTIRRGTVQVDVQIQRPPSADQYQINEDALVAYRRQLQKLCTEMQWDEGVALADLLLLPGVVAETPAARPEVEPLWPLVQEVLLHALERLDQMRLQEGAAMAEDLLIQCRGMEERIERIAGRAPEVVRLYQERLREKLEQALQQYDLPAQTPDLLREVTLFADRCDISEELVRLRSHVDQFRRTVQQGGVVGRKLEFLAQEMGREANTIGAKANDAAIAAEVVELKTRVERLRELVQNIE